MLQNLKLGVSEEKKNGEKPEIRVGSAASPTGPGQGQNPDPRAGSGSTRNALHLTNLAILTTQWVMIIFHYQTIYWDKELKCMRNYVSN